ncbi:hypothetical protein BJX66DRAFT_343758 [Aspergillus keveii]|uniref:Zn(2)-C6 fungal-type domain-containing protein n=1 Tax=Aspergillus keveii TaxID=714993 RepID=A0ABR4FNU4_9EURO
MEIGAWATMKRRRTREDRRRTARACNRCRRLKEKCEGGIPCSRCIHLRHRCEFWRLIAAQIEPPLPDVPRQSEGVNVQELLERVMYMEKILKHRVEGIDLDMDSLRRMATALDEHERRNRRDLATPVPLDDDDPIEEELCTIDPVEDTTTRYSGEFSYWNFSMKVKRHIEDRIPPLKSPTTYAPNSCPPGINSVAAVISYCPPRHIAAFLINVFFKHAATYYFYADRAWLVERVDALYTDPSIFNKNSAAVVSIILTVFAIATQYAYLDCPSPRRGGGTGRPSQFSEDALGTMFYQQAIRFLPEIIEASSLKARSRYVQDLKEWYNNTDDASLIEPAAHHFDGYMQKYFNGWEDTGAYTDRVWTGIMGYTSDDLPHVGKVPGKPGQFVITGFNGHGMPQIFLSAKGVAQMIVKDTEFEETGIPRIFKATQARLDDKGNTILSAAHLDKMVKAQL